MKLVVHVGPHKTASTYIQNNFGLNISRLKKAGWTYPLTGIELDFGHHNLAHNPADYLDENGLCHEELSVTVLRAQEEGQNIVLSSEGYCNWAKRNIIKLADIFDVDQIEIIFVIRNPFERFYSYWSEEVKQGLATSFADRFALEMVNPIGSRLLNPVLATDQFFDDEKIKLHVVPYDLLVRKNIDIFRHISIDVMRITDELELSSQPANTIYPIELTEFLRLVTLIHADNPIASGPGLRMEFIAQTPPNRRRELVELVRKEGAGARRVVSVLADNAHIVWLENALREHFEGLWTYPVDQGALFSQENQKLIYYNEFDLWHCPSVRSEAVKIEKQMRSKLVSRVAGG